MASTVVLARLLGPAEFGLFAMVIAITEFARVVMELGLGSATVQREIITHEEVSALFWVNVGIGVILTIIVAGISPVVAWFYKDARLLSVCMAMSIFFLFGGLTVQHRSLLERQMHFGFLGISYIVSNLIGIFVAIGLAIYGFGIWALVWRELINAAIYAGSLWLLCGWTPSSPKISRNSLPSLRFGADISGVSIVQYFTQNLDRVLVGRFCGATPLGFYTKGMQLAMFPIEHIRMTILGVGISPLSALQGQADRYRNYFSRLFSVLSFLYMPLVVFIAIEAEPLTHLLLGERWTGTAPLLRILAIASIVRPVIATCQLVMISCGKTSRYLRWGAISGACMTMSYVVGIQWGVLGVAYAYTCANYILLGWSLWYCFQGTPVNFIIVVRTLFLPVVSSLGAGIILITLTPLMSNKHICVNLIASIALIEASYVSIWMVYPGGRQKLSQFWSYRSEIFSKA